MKIIDEYKADELGLPIIIKGVALIEVDGHEVLDIDYAKISELLFAALILKPFPLTGAEIRFMRLFMGLTLESLANSLHVTHPTILSWERSANEPTHMTDSTEAMLRIFAARQGAKDNELIGIVLNRFFGGRALSEKTNKCATIVDLNTIQRGEAPTIHFSERDEDLRFLKGA
jgi:DNA-binding transcriptional regulator YiaG